MHYFVYYLPSGGLDHLNVSDLSLFIDVDSSNGVAISVFEYNYQLIVTVVVDIGRLCFILFG